MPRLIGVPSRIYTETEKISQDVTDFSLEESYNLLPTTNVETMQVQRTQGLRDSSVSFSSFLESDRAEIDDNDYAFQFISGNEPHTTFLFLGLLNESVSTNRSADANVKRDVSVSQGDKEGFKEGRWLSVERTKSSDTITYQATNTIEEFWISHGLTGVLSDVRSGTNNFITIDTSTLADDTPILLVFRLEA